MLLAGLSLGAASLTGAALGTAWHTGRRYGKDLLARWRGEKTLCVDDTTLNLLLLRQLSLLRHLFRRGHAALSPVQLNEKDKIEVPSGWREQLARTRALLQLKVGAEHKEYKNALGEMQAWLGRVV